MTGLDGFGVGTCIIYNTGCMSHGSVEDEAHGLSKAIAMGLVLIICPLTEDEPRNFKEAWFACDISNLQPLHVKLLLLLDAAVTQHFWVSIFWGRVNQGWVG